MKNYERLLDRRSKQEQELFKAHKGSEEKLTYHAGYNLGYFSGQVSILEDAAEDIAELKARIAELEANIEKANYAIAECYQALGCLNANDRILDAVTESIDGNYTEFLPVMPSDFGLEDWPEWTEGKL